MKKFSFIGLFLLLSTSFFAQNDTLITNNDYKWKIGVKGLMERSRLLEYDTYSENFFNYGLQGFHKIGRKKNEINIEFGLYLVKRPSVIVLRTHKLTVINENRYENKKLFIPIKFNKNIKLFSDFSLSLSAGGYLEYLISNNFKLPNETLPPESLYNSKYVYGLVYNLGINRNINDKFSITLDVNFSYKITKLYSYEDSYFDFSNLLKPKTSNYGVGIGVLYKIQKR